MSQITEKGREQRPTRNDCYTPKECLELVSDEDIEAVWGNANFGSLSKRDVIKHGVLKVAGGFYQGYTSNQILCELGLKVSHEKNELTMKGRRYLYWAWDTFRGEGV